MHFSWYFTMRRNQGPVPQIGDQKERVTIDIKNFATTAGCEEVASVGFAELAAWIAEHLRVESAVLDGELPVLMMMAVRYFEICFSAGAEKTAAEEAFTNPLPRPRRR
jgi:hypothetical protein